MYLSEYIYFKFKILCYYLFEHTLYSQFFPLYDVQYILPDLLLSNSF